MHFMQVWKGNNIVIYNTDFLKLKLPKNCVDLIVCSPAYNLGINYEGYDDDISYKDYLDFSEKWLKKCYGVLKDGGRICINVPIDTGKNGKRSLAADLTILAKRTGFGYKGTIIWNKQTVKNKYALVFSANVEVVLIFYKKEWRPLKKEFREWINEIWTFAGENPKRVNHPAAFPIELAKRCIKLFSCVGDTVLDPFLGSGTTMVACEMYKRKGIGVEISEKYFENASFRIKNKKW